MDAASVRARLTPHSAKLHRIGVKSLSLFGSAAKGESGPNSDLDFLVEFTGTATFDAYMNLKELLEAEFGTRIDLVTRRALKPLLRESILREAIQVA